MTKPSQILADLSAEVKFYRQRNEVLSAQVRTFEMCFAMMNNHVAPSPDNPNGFAPYDPVGESVKAIQEIEDVFDERNGLMAQLAFAEGAITALQRKEEPSTQTETVGVCTREGKVFTTEV